MITLLIIAITTIVSYFGFKDKNIEFNKLIYSPRRVLKFNEYWRLFSSALLHADWLHLIMNMFVLYSFGSLLENELGSLVFIILYVVSMPLSLVYNLYKWRDSYSYTALGASGAVCAVLFSYITLNPTSTLLFFIIPMPAWLFGLLYIGVSFYLIKEKKMKDVGHDVHITGAIIGILISLLVYSIS